MGWLLALVLSAQPVTGQRPTWVEYVAPAECPSREDFQAELSARTELVRFVETSDEATARVWVTVTKKGQGFEGRLVVEMDGARTKKTIEGSRCPTLKSALTLSSALLLDREHAKLVLPVVSEAPPVSEPPVEAPPEQPEVPPAPPVVVTSPPPATPAPSAFAFALRAGGWLSTGVSGLVDLGGGGRGEFSFALALAPGFRLVTALGAAGLSGRTVTSDAGRVRYAARFLGELDAGVGVSVGVFQAQVLAFGQLAPVFAEGLDGDQTSTSQRWLWAVGPAARVGVVLSGWEIGARVGGAFALRQERYVIDPRGVVFSVPPFAVTAALELGRQF